MSDSQNHYDKLRAEYDPRIGTLEKAIIKLEASIKVLVDGMDRLNKAVEKQVQLQIEQAEDKARLNQIIENYERRIRALESIRDRITMTIILLIVSGLVGSVYHFGAK